MITIGGLAFGIYFSWTEYQRYLEQYDLKTAAYARTSEVEDYYTYNKNIDIDYVRETIYFNDHNHYYFNIVGSKTSYTTLSVGYYEERNDLVGTLGFYGDEKLFTKYGYYLVENDMFYEGEPVPKKILMVIIL